jgi:hypothetical protein
MKEGREEGGNIVSLNVGGAGFATSRSTLMKVSKKVVEVFIFDGMNWLLPET